MEIILAVVGFSIAVVYLGILLNVRKEFQSLKDDFESFKQKQKRQYYYNKKKTNN